MIEDYNFIYFKESEEQNYTNLAQFLEHNILEENEILAFNDGDFKTQNNQSQWIMFKMRLSQNPSYSPTITLKTEYDEYDNDYKLIDKMYIFINPPSICDTEDHAIILYKNNNKSPSDTHYIEHLLSGYKPILFSGYVEPEKYIDTYKYNDLGYNLFEKSDENIVLKVMLPSVLIPLFVIIFFNIVCC